ERGQTGWLLYFPVAFGLKTPLPLLALMVFAAACFRSRGTWDWISLGTLGLLWLLLIFSHVNIGLRYALLTYPLAAIWIGRPFSGEIWRDRIWRPAALGALSWLIVASFAVHPRYLSYFNEVGGGPRDGWLYMADSNIDWGQDFDALIATLNRLDIHEVTYDLSSERRIDQPGILAIRNPGRSRQVPADVSPNRRLY